MGKWTILLVFILGVASAQEALQAIPLLSAEPGAPSLYSSEILREGRAEGRDGNMLLTRDYESKLLVDADAGTLVDVAWTFYQNDAFVVPGVVTRTSGDAKTETFGYVNGFLVGFLANVCFDIPEGDLEALGTWYVATLEELAATGQGEVERRFGPLQLSLELRPRTAGNVQMTQTLWRAGKPGRAWSSFCTLEPASAD